MRQNVPKVQIRRLSHLRCANNSTDTFRPFTAFCGPVESYWCRPGRPYGLRVCRAGWSQVTILAEQVVQQDLSLNGSSLGYHSSKQESASTTAITGQRVEDNPENSRINVISRSKWSSGIPAVMGAHLMASGTVAPLSTSKGPGEGVEHLFFYPEQEQENYVVNQYVNTDAGGKGLVDVISEVAKISIQRKGSFTLVLSGGSLLKALARLANTKDEDFSRWHIAYADERNVPLSSPESNHRGAREAFLDKVNIPRDQVYTLKEGLSVKEAATEYEGQLLRISQKILPRRSDGWPIFDLILLGVGPDGHVASLFPNTTQTALKEGWVLPISNSPKPPPERISLSLPVLNSAANVAIVAFGIGKAEVVHRALEVQSLPGALPAQLVRPQSGRLSWLIDCEAASQLNITKWSIAKQFPRSQ